MTIRAINMLKKYVSVLTHVTIIRIKMHDILTIGRKGNNVKKLGYWF